MPSLGILWVRGVDVTELLCWAYGSHVRQDSPHNRTLLVFVNIGYLGRDDADILCLLKL